MSLITNIESLKLSDEQKYIFERILCGENIFITGGAGTGKSFLIENIKEHLPSIKAARENPEWHAQLAEIASGNTRTIHINDSVKKGLSNISNFVPKMTRVRVTALTGCAAILLGSGSKTLHSWAGIGKGQGTIQELTVKIRASRANRNWLTTDILIVDEISMLTAELLEKLDAIGKRLRASSKPFGGIQVIFVGDFYQLPPVVKDFGTTIVQSGIQKRLFAFQSPIWQTIFKPESEISLNNIYRQKDVLFQKILTEARYGCLSVESENILQKRIGLDWEASKIRPTLLFPRRAEVDMINENNLRALQGVKYTYKVDFAFNDKMPGSLSQYKNSPEFIRAVEAMDRDSPYVSELTLGKGAQVMLVYNLDLEKGLSNGSRGVVVDFDTQSGNTPIVEFKNNIKLPISKQSWEVEEYEGIFRTQIPLRLAYACTIHKSQGASIDSVLIDIGPSTFEYGQAYVALSRVRNLDGLYIHDFTKGAIRAHPDVLKRFPKQLSLDSEQRSKMSVGLR